MDKCRFSNLRPLSDNFICSIPYPEDEFSSWVNGDISFLLNSSAHRFIKDILTHKKRKTSSRSMSSWYFGESYVASVLGDYIGEGWFSSFKWLCDGGWVTGEISRNEKDSVMAKLKLDFYENALIKYIGEEKLRNIQSIGRNLDARAPDLWLIDKEKHHYFIEVKKGGDAPDKKQKQFIGLKLIENCLNCPTFIIYLYPEGKKSISHYKQSRWLEEYNSARIY